MMECIRQIYPEDKWMERLSKRRRELVQKNIKRAREQENLIDQLHYTGMCDKRDLLSASYGGQPFRTSLMNIENLRNALAHAGNYAPTRDAAMIVSEQVADISKWISEIASSSHKPTI